MNAVALSSSLLQSNNLVVRGVALVPRVAQKRRKQQQQQQQQQQLLPFADSAGRTAQELRVEQPLQKTSGD